MAAVALTVAMSSGGAAPGGPRAASQHATPSAANSADQLTYEQDFRAEFGLNSALSYITAVHAGSQGNTVSAFGVLLTPSEAQDLDFRQKVAESAKPPVLVNGHPEKPSPFYAYISAHTDEFAGEYIDQLNHGTVTVLFTGHLAQHAAALASLFPYPGYLRVAGARYTYAQLDRWAQDIANRTMELRSKGVPLVTSGPDVRANAIAVGFSVADAASEAEMRAEFPGVPFTFSIAPHATPHGTDSQVAPPVDAGEGIWDVVAGYGCTAAFAVTGPTTAIGNLYSSSAGHCGPPGDAWDQGPQDTGSYLMGQATASQFGGMWGYGLSVDAMVINDAHQGDVQHNIVISTYSCGFLGLSTCYNIRIVHGQESSPVVGESTCMSRAFSGGEHCSTVQSVNFCYTYTNLLSEGYPQDSATVCYLASANLFSISGDSGSPVYQPQTSGTSMAQGLVSGGNSSGYTQWDEITPALNGVSGCCYYVWG